MIRFQTSSKELYVYYLKEEKIAGGSTNKKALERDTGMSYNIFRKVFDRKGEDYYEDNNVIILRIKTGRISKGLQSLSRKGKGGMEKFARYIIKKDSYDN